ncbi:MAG: hypothetical protein EBR02_10165 [Alphaproteobacteria bacterium]|nr:hypothetical protein [Alphaproteobacteria bacterium]
MITTLSELDKLLKKLNGIEKAAYQPAAPPPPPQDPNAQAAAAPPQGAVPPQPVQAPPVPQGAPAPQQAGVSASGPPIDPAALESVLLDIGKALDTMAQRMETEERNSTSLQQAYEQIVKRIEDLSQQVASIRAALEQPVGFQPAGQSVAPAGALIA